jgi:hypothetical protein
MLTTRTAPRRTLPIAWLDMAVVRDWTIGVSSATESRGPGGEQDSMVTAGSCSLSLARRGVVACGDEPFLDRLFPNGTGKVDSEKKGTKSVVAFLRLAGAASTWSVP